MILDLLPVVGMILVFLPLVIIYFFSGKYVTVIFLVILLIIYIFIFALLKASSKDKFNDQ